MEEGTWAEAGSGRQEQVEDYEALRRVWSDSKAGARFLGTVG